jgi:hypothetical protein
MVVVCVDYIRADFSGGRVLGPLPIPLCSRQASRQEAQRDRQAWSIAGRTHAGHTREHSLTGGPDLEGIDRRDEAVLCGSCTERRPLPLPQPRLQRSHVCCLTVFVHYKST